MTTIRVPTPLRPYTGGAKEVEVSGDTVGGGAGRSGAALPRPEAPLVRRRRRAARLRQRLPQRRRYAHPAGRGDAASGRRPVDDHPQHRRRHRRNRRASRSITPPSGRTRPRSSCSWWRHSSSTWRGWSRSLRWVMLTGTAVGRPGFLWVYLVLRKMGSVKPDVLRDHPQPHRFAQGLGVRFSLPLWGLRGWAFPG